MKSRHQDDREGSIKRSQALCTLIIPRQWPGQGLDIGLNLILLLRQCSPVLSTHAVWMPRLWKGGEGGPTGSPPPPSPLPVDPYVCCTLISGRYQLSSAYSRCILWALKLRLLHARRTFTQWSSTEFQFVNDRIFFFLEQEFQYQDACTVFIYSYSMLRGNSSFLKGTMLRNFQPLFFSLQLSIWTHYEQAKTVARTF